MYLKLIVLTCKNVLASLSKGKWRSWNRARSYVLLCKRAELASIEGPVWGYHSCCRGCKASSQCSEAAHWAGTILICLGAGFQRFLVWEVRAVWAGQGGSSTVGEGPRSLCKREQWFANLTWILGVGRCLLQELETFMLWKCQYSWFQNCWHKLFWFFFCNVLLILNQISPTIWTHYFLCCRQRCWAEFTGIYLLLQLPSQLKYQPWQNELSKKKAKKCCLVS